MPIMPTYPGVYIQEIPSGVRTITGVASAITAFVGRTLRGPVNHPVVVNSYADFERSFGGLWADSPLSFAVRDFFLNGGGQAVIVRLFHPFYASDAERAKARAAAQAVSDAAQAFAPTGADDAAKALSVAKEARRAANTYTADPERAAANDVAVAAEAAASAGKGVDEVRAAAAATIGLAAPVTRAGINANGLALVAASEGAWGNMLRVRIDHEVAPEAASRLGLTKADLFNLRVRDSATGATEQLRNLSVLPGPRQVDKVLLNESALLQLSGALPTTVPGAHEPPPSGKDIWDDAFPKAYSLVDTLASDGSPLAEGDFSADEAGKRGIYALEQVDLFNLLCLPSADDTVVTANLLATAAAYCERRRAVLLVDAPLSWKGVADATTGRDTLNLSSKNAAIFFPRLRLPNPLRGNQIESFPPCGAVAGVIARTDAQRGLWKAPAGMDATLVGVPQLDLPLTDAENGQLNPLGINCLRVMPAVGPVIWGARTAQGDDRLASEWKYLPVRRLALYLEESLYRGTHWVVFEPNDEPLWAQIRLNLGAFMHTLFRQGAFQGRTPRQAYFVKCDGETTTQSDINAGIVNILVGFAPLKPAEFVIISLQQIAGQIQA